MEEKMKVLVTGGSGYIGSYLADALRPVAASTWPVRTVNSFKAVSPTRPWSPRRRGR